MCTCTCLHVHVPIHVHICVPALIFKSCFFFPGLTDLVLLASQPETEGSAITEAFKFLNEILKHGQTSPDEAYVIALTNQVSSLASLSREQLGNVVKRLVLLSSDEEATAIAVNTSLLHTFVELLTHADWCVDLSL